MGFCKIYLKEGFMSNVKKSLLCLITFLVLSGLFGCSSGTSDNATTTSPITPTTSEYQPPYTGASYSLASDYDADGISDYVDIDPLKAATASSIQKSATNSNYVFTETEFNNNMGDANTINKPLPLWVRGSLKNGTNYYYDSDFFKVSLKKGDRVSVVVFNGRINDNGTQIDFPNDMVYFNVAVSDSNGSQIVGRSHKFVHSISGYSFEATEDGNYYIEISFPDLYSQNYELPYTFAIVYDKDFDGVSDDLEKAFGLNANKDDSDGDGIIDFDEIYGFLGKMAGLKGPSLGFTNYFDVDGDKIPNWYDVDSDGDGIPDRVELARDLNKTGLGNYINRDSNGNGKTDTEEAGVNTLYPLDTDKDGIYDFENTDKDGDGIPDELDSDPYTKFAQKNILTSDIPKLYKVYTIDSSNNLIPDVVMAGNKLRIYGSFKSSDIKLFLPTLSGYKTLIPLDVSIDNGTATFSIPFTYDEISGKMCIYSNGEISNFIDVSVIKNSKPIITKLSQTDLSYGSYLTIYGSNLTNSDIQVCYVFDNNTPTCQNAKASHGSVSVDVPSGILSGFIFLNVNGFYTNKLEYSVKRKISASVVAGNGVSITNSNTKIFGLGETYSLNSSMSASIPLDSSLDYLAAFYYDSAGNPYLLYEALVPEGTTTVTLNALSTAVKMVFFNLGLQTHLEKSKWSSTITKLSSLQAVIDLANYIDQLHASDKTKLNAFSDATLIQKFKAAIQAGSNAVQSSSLLKSATPTIKPNYSQYGISLYAYTDYLRLSNDTKSYLSVEVTNPKDKVAFKDPETGEAYVHVSSPWSNNLVGVQGWGLLSLAEDVDYSVANRDSNFEIISAGVKSPRPSDTRVYSFVIVRTVFDGVIATPFDEFVFKKFLGTKLGSEGIANILADFIGAQQWNGFISDITDGNGVKDAVINFLWYPVSNAIQNCLQVPPGDTCQKFITSVAKVAVKYGLTRDVLIDRLSKKVGKEIASYMIPAAGQIKAAVEALSAANNIYTVGGTLYDISSMPGLIKFEVDYPLDITDAIPKCVKKDTDERIEIFGNGFTPYYEGYLWNKKLINPEVRLGLVTGEIMRMDQDGTWMSVRFDTSSLTVGNYKISVKHDNQQILSSFSIQVTDSGAAITDLKPSKGTANTEVIIYGCGLENIDGFYFKGSKGDVPATITYKSENKIQVIVPKDAITGPIYGTVGGTKTNSLNFTVESAKVTITYGDNGAATDDTFSLYIDGKLVSTMPQPIYAVTVNVDLSPGQHTVKLVGITAPDAIGTYYIDFPSNVKVLSGPSTEGSDLTAGVTKTWIVEVLPVSSSKVVKRSRIIGIQPE